MNMNTVNQGEMEILSSLLIVETCQLRVWYCLAPFELSLVIGYDNFNNKDLDSDNNALKNDFDFMALPVGYFLLHFGYF